MLYVKSNTKLATNETDILRYKMSYKMFRMLYKRLLEQVYYGCSMNKMTASRIYLIDNRLLDTVANQV